MIPPYLTQEVAEAVALRLKDAHVAIRNLLVVADLRTREWRVVAQLASGERVLISLPFTRPQGIVLPAEVASRFMDHLQGA